MSVELTRSSGVNIPALVELPPSVCGCRKFQIDPLGDHLCTCTVHSGTTKAHDWSVDQFPDLFRTTHKVKKQQVSSSRGQRCGDIELAGYLGNTVGPLSLVLDLHITHDKIRKNRTDYNNNPPNSISFIPAIASTSGWSQ